MVDYTKMSDSELLKLYQDKKAVQGYPKGSTVLPNGIVGRTSASGAFTAYPGQASATASPEVRSRIAIGLDPSIIAESNIEKATAAGNPLNTWRGATASMLAGEGEHPIRGYMAQKLGGQEFQNLQQGGKTFESAFLPILSGAQVTISEAQRLIRASQPEPGNSPETLRRKQINRQLMINGAAVMAGRPKPFPNVGSVNPTDAAEVVKAFSAAAPAAPVTPAAPVASGQINYDSQGRRVR